MIGVIEYGTGNTGNVLRAFTRIGIGAKILASPEDRHTMSLLLLPGVGAFGPAMDRLRETGWADAIRNWNDLGRPIIGICLGMQLLCESSEENGYHKGLGLLHGRVEALQTHKRLHMGWNGIRVAVPGHESYIPDGAFMYFVHGYCVTSSLDTATITRFEDKTFASTLRRGNCIGFQFHPERSGPVGLKLLASVTAELSPSKGVCGESVVA